MVGNGVMKKAKVYVGDQIIMRMTDTIIKVLAKHNPNATTSTLLAAPPIYKDGDASSDRGAFTS
jgi:hypothetical protein